MNRHKASGFIRPYLILILVLLLCLPAISVISNINISDSAPVIARQISSGNRVHYRFRRIYNGSDLSNHRSQVGASVKSLPTMSASSARYTDGSYAINSHANQDLAVAPINSAASILRSSSSASQHSYGGGAQISSTGNYSSTSSHQTATALSNSFTSVNPHLLAVNTHTMPTSSVTQPEAEAAPEEARHAWGGSSGSPVTPLQDALIPLLLFAIAYFTIKQIRIHTKNNQ